MNIDFENPFADYGNIIRGERFIGRKESLEVIESRIVRPKEAGNLAIIGEPRIGKSSLVYKSVIDRKEEFIARKFIPIWINLATYDKSSIFFRSLVMRCMDEMEDLGWLSEPIQRAAERALEDELSWSEGYNRIQRFFEKVRKAGYRVLFILDEFDHARRLFKGDVSGFQGLRELSYRPEWRVYYITTSRRRIRHIEEQTGAISTLDGIFHKHYLGMFNSQDIEEYLERLSSIGIPVSPGKGALQFYCGGHPYLLEMLGYEIVELFREEQKIEVEQAANRIIQSFLDQYDRMVDLLREDGSLDKMLQILFGPVVDVKQTDVDEFLKYGLIKAYQESYVGFSEHFHNFLKLVEREIAMSHSKCDESNLLILWQNTEKILRQIITTKMLNLYGERWVEKLEKSYRQKLKPIFDGCREAQQKEKKSFGNRASQNLIDFTYPKDLFAIIFAEWKGIFEPIFGGDKKYWEQRAQLLSKIRNPLAHNRDEVLQEYECKIAEGYCKEIHEKGRLIV
jgi:hypothetical protein